MGMMKRHATLIQDFQDQGLTWKEAREAASAADEMRDPTEHDAPRAQGSLHLEVTHRKGGAC